MTPDPQCPFAAAEKVAEYARSLGFRRAHVITWNDHTDLPEEDAFERLRDGEEERGSITLGLVFGCEVTGEGKPLADDAEYGESCEVDIVNVEGFNPPK